MGVIPMAALSPADRGISHEESLYGESLGALKNLGSLANFARSRSPVIIGSLSGALCAYFF